MRESYKDSTTTWANDANAPGKVDKTLVGSKETVSTEKKDSKEDNKDNKDYKDYKDSDKPYSYWDYFWNSNYASTANTTSTTNTVPTANTSSSANPVPTANTTSSIFNNSTFILLLWFLVIYVIAYFLLGFIFNNPGQGTNPSTALSTMLDLFALGGIVLFIIIYYYSSTPEQQSKFFGNGFENIKSFIDSSSSIIGIIVFIIVFYIVIYLLRIPMSSESKPIIISLIESCAWILLVIIGINDFFKYVLRVDLMNLLPSYKPVMKAPEPKKASPSETSSKQTSSNEVFNISNNLYTYEDAQAICKSYDATLATYDQVENSYNNGGEWCNYGWSANQMILFPTQKSTWKKLQKNPKHKNDCGRPGVNGGYIANPYVRFGVNCYGKKPPASTNDLNRMTAKQNQVYPASPEEKALQNKVDFWKQNSSKLLQINSYNTKKWSEVS